MTNQLVKKADVKRNFKTEYNLVKPKYTTSDGRKQKSHDVNSASWVYTNVVHSPIDATSVKSDKVNAKLTEIKNWFLNNGAVEENGTMYFNKGTNKEFGIHVSKDTFIDTYEYDGYYAAYIYVGF